MIRIRNLTKKIGRNKSSTIVLNQISFDVNKKEFISIFGPNGCGKSTLLKIIGGIEEPTSGNFSIQKNGQKLRIGYIFQSADDSMMPWKTVFENITFGLESQNINKEEKKLIANNLLKRVNLYKTKDVYFCNLSGGMKQLVAICRTLAFKPNILLLDEPFSSLDYFTTKKMQSILVDLWEKSRITTLFVSHDVDEAIYLSDKVIILSDKPTYVKKIVNIDLPRPRNYNCLRSNEFFVLKNEILNLVKHE